jgi:hypothetical protein
MIRRIQTFWLLLAAIAALVSLKLSIFSGMKPGDNQVNQYTSLTGSSNFIILILTAGTGVVAAIIIFLYKNRKMQIRFTWIALILSIINLIMYYLEARKFTNGNYSLTALVVLIIPVLLILALRGIYKDEKLIKASDRLR